MKFDGNKYYKEVMCTDKEYEKVLNMYTEGMGLTAKIHMEDYETLEELKDAVTTMVISNLSNVWKYYFEFCDKKLKDN